MKISTQNKISLVSVYLVLIVITGYLLEHEVSGSIDEMMENTSELIVKEVKSALSEPLEDYFQKKYNVTPKEIRDIILATTEKSDTIVLVDVLSTNGEVFISSNNTHVGKVAKIPQHLFKENSDPKLTKKFKEVDDTGTHILWAPLMKDGKRLGYLRIGLREKGLSTVFDKIYVTLMVSALIGLLSLLALDMLLHLQLERITNGLMSLMGAAIRGEVEKAPHVNDEFTQVRQTARKLSEEIRKAKTQANIARRELDTVVNHLKVGLIITDSENAVDFINDRAKLLISPSSEIDQYLEGLDSVMPQLQSAVQYLQDNNKLTHSIPIVVDQSTQTEKINAEFYRLDQHEWHGCAIILHDQDFIDALNDDLQSAAHLRALSTLLLGAIHDIKAPINAMKLNLELLGEAIAPSEEVQSTAESLEEQLNYVGIIKAELDRLNHLIGGLYEQILGEDKAKTSGNLITIIDELGQLINPQAKSQRVNITFDKPDTPVIFFGYPGQIKQAVLNILLNALEILPNGGEIKIGLESSGQTARLVICDSGPGIPSSLRDRIFDMHFTTKATGTGIGLYVSRQIITKHGGNVSVISELGDGACFEINLPVQGSQAKAEQSD